MRVIIVPLLGQRRRKKILVSRRREKRRRSSDQRCFFLRDYKKKKSSRKGGRTVRTGWKERKRRDAGKSWKRRILTELFRLAKKRGALKKKRKKFKKNWVWSVIFPLLPRERGRHEGNWACEKRPRKGPDVGQFRANAFRDNFKSITRTWKSHGVLVIDTLSSVLSHSLEIQRLVCYCLHSERKFCGVRISPLFIRCRVSNHQL